MATIKATGTQPERLLVAALRKLGLRPTTHCKNVAGKPDIVFSQERLACFVDGELWHGGQWRRRGLTCLDDQFTDSKKRPYWLRKINSNISRDIRVTAELVKGGWSVIRLWASDVEKDPIRCAERIAGIRSGDEKPHWFSRAATATVADFFAGIGLMRLGVEKAGWSVVWANDYDSAKRALYLHNLESTEVEFDPRPIEEIRGADVPPVGLVSACFPCTDLSLAGAVRGLEKGPESSSFLEFAKILEGLKSQRPPFVILENVLGLIHSHGGKDFRTVLRHLASAGYRIDALKIDAVHFVPQSRPRLFLIGVRDDIDIAPTLDAIQLVEATCVRPRILTDAIHKNRDLPWAIRTLPEPPLCIKRVAELLDDLDDGDQSWWSAERVDRLQRQVSPRHQETMAKLVSKHRVVWATAFRRMRNGRSMAELRFDGIAGCLRTPKGGSAKQIVIRANRSGWKARLINPAECSRLMGANDFRLDAAGIRTDDAYFGFGDAVCVPAVEWLVRNYVNPLMAELLRGKLLSVNQFPECPR